MDLLSKRANYAAVGITILGWALAASPVLAEPPADQKPVSDKMLSDRVFKNVQALKGIPADDFMGTMGIMTDSLGFDCSECHNGAGTDQVDWAYDTPRKIISRRMVQMVDVINKSNFSGRQMITCWTCHRGRDRPVTTEPMENIYNTPPMESDDVIRQLKGLTPAVQILEKYIEAVGGAQKLAGLKSVVGEGKSAGFGGFGGEADVHLYAKAPDERSIVIDYKNAPGRGDTTRSYDGHVGWLRTPLNVLGEYELTGSELDGTRLDSLLTFPGQIKQIFTDLRSGPPTTISDLPSPSSQSDVQSSIMIGQDRPVNVVQGTGPRGLLATMYFDRESGLLMRLVRYGKSPIGRYSTQIDYGDYREVDGIKFPFRMTFAWMDGRDAIQLTEVKTNVTIDAAKFGKPPALKASR